MEEPKEAADKPDVADMAAKMAAAPKESRETPGHAVSTGYPVLTEPIILIILVRLP
ncbi:hypothetical protein Barb7_02082 [Bacteroidales bacterium Barb7]|nr:hypothetical protein Barb7_02082 [Bacteroidales bacterium Barb7]